MSSFSHPYKDLPSFCFWNTFTDSHPFNSESIPPTRFTLENRKIATAGSCFAQHIGSHLKNISNAQFLDAETPPSWLPRALWHPWGYDLYSARYGNIYTVEGLLQLFRMAVLEWEYDEKPWEKEGSYVDPFRPTICHRPFLHASEVEEQRKIHLKKVRDLFSECDTFIFTLGLTEAWRSKRTGAVFPVVPGSRQGGGVWDPDLYEFVNFDFDSIVAGLEEFNSWMKLINRDFRLMLTVSPVPLAATATGQDVRIANSYSKSTLRSAAGYMRDHHENVEYFPSYEMITSPAMRGIAYEADGRHISPYIVSLVMDRFKKTFRLGARDEDSPGLVDVEADPGDVLCDEEILLAFNQLRKSRQR